MGGILAPMKSTSLTIALARASLIAAILLGGATAQAQLKLAGISEAKGGGAVAGGNFRNGYLMAVDEINAKGGVLGQRIELKQYDIDTKPDDAVKATSEAMATKPFAILGPVFSGLTSASMAGTAESRTPQLTGGEAASLSRKFHPSLLRTTLTQAGSVPRLAALAVRGAGLSKVAVLYVDNEFGRDGKDLLVTEIKRRGAQVVFDQAVKPGTTDFAAAAAAVKKAAPDGLVLYVNESEGPPALKALRAAGFDKPILGDGPLVSQSVLDAAGDAADGLLAHTSISLDVANPQVQDFVRRYVERYNKRPDHNSVKGWFAVQVIKAVCEQLGRIDQAAFLKFVKEQPLDRSRNPALLSSASYDFFGDLNRDSYYVRVQGGSTSVLGTIRRAEGGTLEQPDGRVLVIDSREFRNMIAGAASATPASAKPAKAAKAGTH